MLTFDYRLYGSWMVSIYEVQKVSFVAVEIKL